MGTLLQARLPLKISVLSRYSRAGLSADLESRYQKQIPPSCNAEVSTRQSFSGMINSSVHFLDAGPVEATRLQDPIKDPVTEEV